MDIDYRYECEAPKFRDFDRHSTGSLNSAWFDTHEEYENGGLVGELPGNEEVLGDVSNIVQAASVAVVQTQSLLKKSNIVTTWGQDVKKRSAEEGVSGERIAKSKKRDNGSTVPQPGDSMPAPQVRSTRSKAAHAEGRKESTKERQRPLRAVPVTLKRKGKLLAAKQPRRVMPARSTKQLTIPEDMELHTSRRAKEHSKVQAVDHRDHVDDGSDADTEVDPGTSPYKPLSLRVREFDKTPGRFKKKPEPLPPPKPLSITEAKEPALLTSARARPRTFKSREESEAEEMARMPVFRASTLNPLILSTSGQLGVPKVDKRGTTEQQPFSFITDDRAEARAKRQAMLQQPAKTQWERQTVSDNETREKPGKNRPGKTCASLSCSLMDPVQSRSPKLLTKLRARETKFQVERYEFHARPVPKFLSVHSLELPKGVHSGGPSAPTQPQPFRLATNERGAKYRAEMETKLAEEERAARLARVPRAHGLPLSTDMPMVPPKPEPRGLTVPEPFCLLSEFRHKDHEDKLQKVLEEEEAAKRMEADFKARPMWRGNPFQIHSMEMPITVPEAISLRTSARVAAREQYNKKIDEKWKEVEAAAKAAEEEKRLREEEERRHLRKATRFHALPLPDLSAPPAAKPPPPPKPSTKPVSPKLATLKRRRTRQKHADDDEQE